MTWAADRTVLVAGPWARDGTIVGEPVLLVAEGVPAARLPEGRAVLATAHRAAGGGRAATRLGARGAVRGLPLGPPSGGERRGLLVRRRPAADPARRVMQSGGPRATQAGMWDTLRDDPGAARRRARWRRRPPRTSIPRPTPARRRPPGRRATATRRATCSTARQQLDAEHPSYYGSRVGGALARDARGPFAGRLLSSGQASRGLAHVQAPGALPLASRSSSRRIASVTPLPRGAPGSAYNGVRDQALGLAVDRAGRRGRSAGPRGGSAGRGSPTGA